MASLPSRTLFLQGIPKTFDETKVRNLISSDSIERVVLKLDSINVFTGCAYVIFDSSKPAESACIGIADSGIQVDFLRLDQSSELETLLDESQIESDFLIAFQKLTPVRKQLAMSKLGQQIAALGQQGTATQCQPTGTTAGAMPVSSLNISDVQPHANTSSPHQAAHAGGAAMLHDGRMVADLSVSAVPVYQDVPRLPLFSGEPHKDCTFSRWRYEVTCLLKDNYSVSAVHNAIRKSLKSPAADVLCRLGNVDIDHLLLKFQSLYGAVYAGQSILQRFYSECQGAHESAVQWSCRLEEYMYEALDQDLITPKVAKKTLGSRFWNGLRDDRIKNALRHRESVLPFEELVLEARRVEEEYPSSHQPSQAQKRSCAVQQQVKEGKDDDMKTLLDRLSRLETELAVFREKTSQFSQQPTSNVTPVPFQNPGPQAGLRPQVRSSNNHASSSSGTNTGFRGPRPQAGVSSRPLRCHKCQQIGHLAFGCRSGQNVVCHNCQGEGHIRASCLN